MNRGAYGFPRGRRKKLTHGRFVGARVVMVGTFSVVSTVETAVPWDTPLWNYGRCLDPANPSRLVAPVEGWYDICASINQFDNITTFLREFIDLNFGTPLGGSQVKILARRDTTNVFRGVAVVSSVIFMRAREFVEVGCWQNTGATKTYGGAVVGSTEYLCSASIVRRG